MARQTTIQRRTIAEAGSARARAPGLTARIAAARAVSEALTLSRPLDERFAADLSLRAVGLDSRDRALARSIATVALRRLGTIRKALAQRLDKGLPRRGGRLEWSRTSARRKSCFSTSPITPRSISRSRLFGPTLRARRLRRSPMRCCVRSPVTANDFLAGSDPLRDDTPAWLAARWIATYGETTARAIAGAHRFEPTLDLTVKSDPAGWAGRLGGIVLPTGSVRLDTHQAIPELEGYADGEWWVQDAAAALPARLIGGPARPCALSIFAPRRGKERPARGGGG